MKSQWKFMAASEEDWLKTKTFAMGKWGQRLAGVSARNCSQHFSVFKQSEKTNKNKNKKSKGEHVTGMETIGRGDCDLQPLSPLFRFPHTTPIPFFLSVSARKKQNTCKM